MSVNIAVQGCCHGELDTIYQCIRDAEQRTGKKVDILIIGGDFECLRCTQDLNSMAVPPKYRHMNCFLEYLLGIKRAPVLTVFVGGNHEASNVLQDLYYGGYVAPKIYFMGYGGVVRFKGLRIGGMSGIYDKHHYQLPHFESPPYDRNALRSVYHTRSLDIHRLLALRDSLSALNPLDIFVSHDWPLGVYYYGDLNRLLKIKPYFREDIDKGQLGSPALTSLLNNLQPTYWFAAHLHVKMSAIVPHEDKTTRFLALDKVIKGRDFLQFLSVPTSRSSSAPLSSLLSSDSVDAMFCQGVYEDNELHFDVPFMSIVKSTHYKNQGNSTLEEFLASQPFQHENMRSTLECLTSTYGSDLVIPPMHHIVEGRVLDEHVKSRGNPQTDKLLDSLKLRHIPPWLVPVDPALKNSLDQLYVYEGML